MKNSSSIVLLPEKICLLWGGFLGFTIAFTARLLASGDPAEALFCGAIGCLLGGWMGKALQSYLNASLKRTSPGDDALDPREPAPTATSAKA